MGAIRGAGLAWTAILIAWCTLVASCTVLLGFGAAMTTYFEPTTKALQEAHVGNLLILGGSAGILFGAIWAKWMRAPLWASILVAVPAALVGGLALVAGGSLLPQLSYLLAVPLAIAAMISVLVFARPTTSTAKVASNHE